jgi:upstream activation factor subunit UAF30
MPKQTKAKTTASASAPVTEVVAPAPVVVAPVVQEVATKVKKVKETKKVAEPVAPVVSASAVSTPAPAVSAPEHVDEPVVEIDTSLVEKSVEFCAKLQQLGALIASLKSEFKTLEKQWSRDLKSAQKASTKRKRKSGNRAPSGFVKPTRISDELAQFLGKQVGAEMARTEVTRDINAYIRTNNLQDKSNGRKIIPDVKLSSLLKLNNGEELTYFNLQRYMSPHFSKTVKPSAETVA